MLVNQGIAVSTSNILLVPYEGRHVPTYHEWMKDEKLLEATASEPLTLDEEYNMQRSWRIDYEKLTFIACLPLENSNGKSELSSNALIAGKDDGPERMLGDVNLYLSKEQDGDNFVFGEVEIMIAQKETQGHGYGRATLMTFLTYLARHEEEIAAQYAVGRKAGKVAFLKVKINKGNIRSIRLFESIGFRQLSPTANYFGEMELKLEGQSGEAGSMPWHKRFAVDSYQELEYSD